MTKSIPQLTRACFIVFAALAASCTVGPDYVRPSAAVPTTFKEAGAKWQTAQPNDAAARDGWWQIYGDADLNALEAQIDISNQNIKAAEAAWRQAQALAQASRAALFPVVSAGASATRSNSGSTNTINQSTGQVSVGGATRNNYNVALNASWEIDLWGRIRRTIEASDATAQASNADLQAAKLSAQAELATDYWLLRVQDATIQLLQDTADAYAKSLQLTRNQYAVGVAGRLDVAQAETQFSSTQAQLIDATIQRAQLEHAIALLIGKAPADFTLPATALHAKFPLVPPGLPSTLLERRPDIAGAERRVAAANAQVGVAEAAFFPDLTLSASGGFQNSVLSSLFSAPSRYWSIGSALAQTIFDAGLRKAQTDQAIAAYDQTVATYRETVLTAFQDVEDNLVALRVLADEAVAAADAVKGAREVLTITNNQYKAGIANYLAVVIAQATALNNERTALAIVGRRLTANVALIKALGGGWPPGPEAAAAATATDAPAAPVPPDATTANPSPTPDPPK